MGPFEDLQLPPGYRLDLTHDPDVPHLRRPDGYPVAIFGRGASPEAIGRLAWADHRVRTIAPVRGRRSRSPRQGPLGPARR